MTALGIRHNNPGNIELSHVTWLGQLPRQPGDKFCRFATPEHGLRAIADTLMTYEDRHECPCTIRGWISRYAPRKDFNPTEAYIKLVSFYAHTTPDAPVDIRSFATAEGVLRGIVHQENGEQPYDDDTLARALAMLHITAAAPDLIPTA